jgi:hypothetical protein
MGFWDSLLGRTRLPPPDTHRLFAMSTAAIALEAAGLRPSGRMGVVFKRLPAGRFDRVEGELRQMLALQHDVNQPDVAIRRDALGFDWLMLTGPDFQESLAALHMAATQFLEEGMGDLLLACVFRFEQEGRAAFWIYNYKRSRFYPFVPSGARRRDTAEELRLAALAASELPVEADRERWYPLWDAPV